MSALSILPTIRSDELAALDALQIRSVERFLRAAETAPRRLSLSQRARISEDRLLELAHLADLMRISGLGPTYIMALHRIGVASVGALAGQEGDTLFARLDGAAAADIRIKRRATADQVLHWIAQAGRLERGVYQ